MPVATVPSPSHYQGDSTAAQSRKAEVGSVMGEESAKERLDREFIELLNELRVLLAGVQVLFAFLLTCRSTRAS
jgi:hypothetical protein